MQDDAINSLAINNQIVMAFKTVDVSVNTVDDIANLTYGRVTTNFDGVAGNDIVAELPTLAQTSKNGTLVHSTLC
jgi:hypothetical protein